MRPTTPSSVSPGVPAAEHFARLVYPGLGNVGDAIQTLAAMRFLPGDTAEVDRERISEPQLRAPAKLILNGWFMHRTANWPPHPSIHALPISMHFAEPGRNPWRRLFADPRDTLLSGAGADWLRTWGPVGARDLVSLQALEERGIPAWHSGCLTLTLRRPAGVERGDEIVACDLPDDALARVRSLARGRRLAVRTHSGAEMFDGPAKEQAARALLETYGRAAAVVTTRIHAALPCLALGTPVLLLVPGRAVRRVTDIARLMHSCALADFVNGACDFDLADPPANPSAHLPLARELSARCAAFTGFDAAATA